MSNILTRNNIWRLALIIFVAMWAFAVSDVYAVDTQMSDGGIDNVANQRGTPHTRALVWVDNNNGYMFYRDNSDLFYEKTTNGGTTWGVQVSVQSGNADEIKKLDLWYDPWTKGDTGTLIHLAWIEDLGADSLEYMTIDTDDDSESSITVIDSTIEVSGLSDSYPWDESQLSLTKNEAGGLNLIYLNNIDGDNSHWRWNSVDGWEEAATVFDTNEADVVVLTPGNETDAFDIYALYMDRSANAMSYKTFDDSSGATGAWSEQAIEAIADDETLGKWQFVDAAQRHSDGHTIGGYWNDSDTSTADLRMVDITNASTFSIETNPVTDSAESGLISILINNQTGALQDNIHIFYVEGATLGNVVGVKYDTSTDGMSTWAGVVDWSEDADNEFELIAAGVSVNDNGGWVGPIWLNDDNNILYNNLNNDIEITPVTGTTRRFFFIGSISPSVLTNLLAFENLDPVMFKSYIYYVSRLINRPEQQLIK